MEKKKNNRHGLTKNPTYTTWRGIKQRCMNTKDKFYKDYGGRGITVCERWLDVRNFVEDMYPSYREGLSIERIDNNKGYSKENCRWATLKEQARNMRNNKKVTLGSETKILVEWCEELSLNYNKTQLRLSKLNWSVEEAFGLVPRKK